MVNKRIGEILNENEMWLLSFVEYKIELEKRTNQDKDFVNLLILCTLVWHILKDEADGTIYTTP